MPATTYSLIFVNQSTNRGDVCVYQSDPNINVPGVMSLAWFSKLATPSTEIQFEWQVNYNFVWSETGSLKPGVIFSAAQRPAADLTESNQITLDHTGGAGGAYDFINQRRGPVAGNLFIDTTNTVPLNRASVGIGMSGVGTYAVQAQPNFNLVFSPHPRYWITFGTFVRGQVLDITRITNKAEVRFDPGVFSMTAILQRDNKWNIETTGALNTALLAAQTKDPEARFASLPSFLALQELQ
ncbi:MAG TPA: protein rhiA [Thermoanaerobaculia bacterium]|nr:protein rhiA [Thermoanaerobaculia bacterium]